MESLTLDQKRAMKSAFMDANLQVIGELSRILKKTPRLS